MREDSVFIVGGGPSLEGFDFSKLRNKNTIAVNDAIFHVPDANYFISMDYTWLTKNNILLQSPQRRKFLSPGIHKVFVVAFAGDSSRCEWTETGVIDKKFDLSYDLSLFDQVVPSVRYGGIGLDFSDFRTGSDSGFSALQLAIILGYKKIFLLGMDFAVVRTKESPKEVVPDKKEVWISFKRRRNRLPQVIAIKSCNKTHFNKKMGKDRIHGFEKKLGEFLTPYPATFQEIKEKTRVEIFSCSPISKLNSYIPFKDFSEIS